jgi:hypothetical protein
MQAELFDPDPYCHHVIATNREEMAGRIVHLHNPRGQVEDFFTELKGGFGTEWISCEESYANTVFFRLGSSPVTYLSGPKVPPRNSFFSGFGGNVR